MEWSSSITINFKNDVVGKAIESIKKTMKAKPYKKRIGVYKKDIETSFCNILDDMFKYGEFEPNVIELFDMDEGAYDPKDTIEVMKDVLTDLAKSMPQENFTCNVECNSTYADSTIKAVYNGETLTYEYFYGDVCWNEIECEECGEMWTVEEYNPTKCYVCPECGTENRNEQEVRKDKIVIPIN